MVQRLLAEGACVLETVLVVVTPFGAHRVGDVIGDAGRMREAVAGENAHDVVRVSAPAAARQEV